MMQVPAEAVKSVSQQVNEATSSAVQSVQDASDGLLDGINQAVPGLQSSVESAASAVSSQVLSALAAVSSPQALKCTDVTCTCSQFTGVHNKYLLCIMTCNGQRKVCVQKCVCQHQRQRHDRLALDVLELLHRLVRSDRPC